MRLRTFIAANMSEAIDQIRRELGSDAIIVSSFSNSGGEIEITAAVEKARPSFSPGPPSGSLPDIEASLEDLLQSRLRAPLPGSTSAAEPVHSGIAFDENVITEALDAQGLPANLCDALTKGATSFNRDDAVAALASALEARFSFEPVPVMPTTPIMLIGLPGAGKTVTMAKLAANAILQGLPVDLISTDAERLGARAQGEAFGKLLDVGFRVAANYDALSSMLNEQASRPTSMTSGPGKACFIDTTSVNPFDRAEFSNLARLVGTTRDSVKIEPVLIVSATSDAKLLCEAAASFAQLGARRLIITQVDIARRIGSALAAADAANLALAQISVTPYLARGLGQMNSLICARLILGTHPKSAGTKSISVAS